ncbi:GNAT family N-acetyltransferase [Pilimelia columellifera]|uniref:GNAT family N-acetyltransferase n=1 Tax=Pilimelia columellifera subsp. columellifera TaxID=706583 RepID=A0ABP6B2A2_9ACTN
MTEPLLRVASFAELDAADLYEILRLRAEVFVVEQNCPYQDLDGRDREAGARHVWAADRVGNVLGCLRVLGDPDGVARIGRVVVAPAARGSGLAQRLMTEALRLSGDRPVVLSAQAHLAGFYAGFGFVVDGPGFMEDGIPHLPMRRPGLHVRR